MTDTMGTTADAGSAIDPEQTMVVRLSTAIAETDELARLRRLEDLSIRMVHAWINAGYDGAAVHPFLDTLRIRLGISLPADHQHAPTKEEHAEYAALRAELARRHPDAGVAAP